MGALIPILYTIMINKLLLVLASLVFVGSVYSQNTITHTITGPGTYDLAINGTEIENDFSFTVPEFDPALGTLTKVEIRRLETDPGFAFILDYAGEYTVNSPVTGFRHNYFEKGWFTFEPFVGVFPASRIRTHSEATGWTYCWPNNCGTVNLPAFDGTIDYAGTTGYSGQINGVTGGNWLEVASNKINEFKGTGSLTLYYCPRFYETLTGVSGHWGVSATNCVTTINSYEVRYTYN